MNPVVKFSINVEAIDCYLYGGYLFLVMADGQLLYVSYHKVVNRLTHIAAAFGEKLKDS